MRSITPFFILLVAGVGALKLSMDENLILQEKCGKKPLQRKMINGEAIHLGQYPWAVSTYTRFHIKTEGGIKRKITIFPGTIISPSHILAFNLIRPIDKSLNIYGLESLNSNGTCEGDHLILPAEFNVRFDYDFEYYKEYNKKRHFQETVVKVIILNGCKQLDEAKLMILELNKNIDFKDARPACLSNSPKQWNKANEFPVYGINSKGIFEKATYAPVSCSVEAPFSCAEAVNKTQGMCRGDYGGSAVANIDKRHTVLGLFARGNQNCKVDPATIPHYEFVNVGYYREAICEVTGICVPAPIEMPDESSITTKGTIVEDMTTEGTTTEGTTTEGTTTESTTTEGTTTEGTTTEGTTTIEPDTTTTAYVPTTTRVGENREIIKAETYEPMNLNCSSSLSEDAIKAEKIQPMELNRGASRGTRHGSININIYLNNRK